MFFTSKKGHSPDYVFIATAVMLTIFGLAILSSASSDLGKIKFDDAFYYLKHQIYFGLALGVVGFVAGFFIYYKKWQPISFILLIISIIGLILVFTPLGFKSGGATRWLNIGSISVQPAEFLKLSFMIYLAAWLNKKRESRRSDFVSGILPFMAITAFVGALIILQPATTVLVIIISASFIVYFVSGVKIRHLLVMAFLGLLAIGIIISSTQYRMNRFLSFFNGTQDAQKSGYHLNQAQIAIGSGGIYGRGFGQSTLKYKFLPEPLGDSIFAVVAEEFGFIGSMFLIALFVLFFIRGFLIAKNCRDNFGKFLAAGFVSIIAIQAFINIGAISGLLPLTGVPLPFISFGGTALAVFLTMSGIIANISKYS